MSQVYTLEFPQLLQKDFSNLPEWMYTTEQMNTQIFWGMLDTGLSWQKQGDPNVIMAHLLGEAGDKWSHGPLDISQIFE